MTSFTTAFLLSIVSTFRRQNMIDEDVNLSTLLKDFETEKVTPPFSTKLMESAKTKQNIYYVSKLCLHRKCFKRHKSCHQYFFEVQSINWYVHFIQFIFLLKPSVKMFITKLFLSQLYTRYYTRYLEGFFSWF